MTVSTASHSACVTLGSSILACASLVSVDSIGVGLMLVSTWAMIVGNIAKVEFAPRNERLSAVPKYTFALMLDV